MSFLFFSPVGETCSAVLPAIVERMASAGGEILLGVYDGWTPDLPAGRASKTRVVHEPGMRKWQMARKHLVPDLVAEYDYIFLWDDDLDISDFDPEYFLKIMRINDLEAAQPSILSPHPLSHAITRQKPCGNILGNGLKTVGRITNFVEIMAPAFSRVGWQRVYRHLDDNNPEAFGYDYIPLGLRGIVDCMHVVHTRLTRPKKIAVWETQKAFYQRTGFRTYKAIEMGYLTVGPGENGTNVTRDSRISYSFLPSTPDSL